MLIGLPLAWLFVFRRAARQRNPQAVWLAVPSVMMPALFALMLYSKSSFYLPTLVAMFGVLLAVALAHGLRSTFAVRLAICASIVVVTGFGGMGLTQMHLRASQIASPQAYLAALRQAVPAQARVLGMPNHWLGLLANPYRAIHLTFYLTSPYIEPHPVSLATALQHIAPEIVLMDTFLDELYSDRSTPQTSQRSDVFWQFMRDHHARLTATIQDNAGNPIRVYQLTY